MERLGDDVSRELGRFGTGGVMAEIVRAWPEVVGGAVAANAWPARIARDGTLHVSASSSAWSFELQQLEGEITGRLRESIGEAAPGRLRFAPGPLPEAAPTVEERTVTPLMPTIAHARTAREWAAGIEAEDLRKTVEKAARASLARAVSDRGV